MSWLVGQEHTKWYTIVFTLTADVWPGATVGVFMCKIMAVSLLVLASVGDDGSRQQTLWQRRRNGEDLTVAPEPRLLKQFIKKMFTQHDDSDSTKSVGRIFKEDQSGPAAFGEQLLPEASCSRSGKKEHVA